MEFSSRVNGRNHTFIPLTPSLLIDSRVLWKTCLTQNVGHDWSDVDVPSPRQHMFRCTPSTSSLSTQGTVVPFGLAHGSRVSCKGLPNRCLYHGRKTDITPVTVHYNLTDQNFVVYVLRDYVCANFSLIRWSQIDNTFFHPSIPPVLTGKKV